MGSSADLKARHSAARWLCAALYALVSIFVLIPAASAQDTAIMRRGDAAVTAFSGAKQVGEVPPGLHPADVTFINPNGSALQVFDLTTLGGAPAGQVANAPIKFRVTAGEIGQVFAIGLSTLSSGNDDAPDIVTGATSAFGLQIVRPDSDGDGRPERVKTGHPDAEWMAGQFGQGGGPGSIWKVDGETGAVSLFATIPDNSGPGLGDIAFDPATHQFFVSNLDDGRIYRLDSAGAVLDTFDHGQTGRTAAGLAAVADDGATADITSPAFDGEDPATWGFAQPERRVWGLGLRAGRLYYAVAEGPSIWSVSINLDGTFGADPRREIEVSGTPANHPISDIAFDSADYMYIAQRGGIKGSYDYTVFADPKQSVVWRFKREIPDDPATPGIWVPIPDEYAIGFPPDYRNTSGGIALGYGYDEAGNPRPGACDAFVWSTGDSLRDNAEYAAQLAAGGPAIIHGLQGNDRSLIRPDNEPPFASYFVDYDGKLDDPDNAGHAGDVEIWQPCDPKADFGSYAPTPYLPPEYVPPAYFPPEGETPPEWVPPIGWPEGAFNLRLDKEAIPGACVPGGLGFICDYVVRVTNIGPDPYAGVIVVNDSLPAVPAGAVMTFANVPPWFCFAIAPTEHQCMFGPTVLLPGDSVDLYVTVDLPVAAPVCHLDNQANIVWPLGFGDANPADDFDWATALIPAGHCPPPVGEKTNLKIEKFALNEVCRDAGANFECDFLVVVRNMGPGFYDGTIKVDEIVPAGTTATFWGSPKWTFSPVPPYSAEHEQVVLGLNEPRSFGVVLSVPKNLAADLACNATNKVKIVDAQGGTDQNTDPTDDEAEATMILPGNVADCPDLGPLSNLKLFKTGPDEKCPVVDSDWVCEFIIKVQNFGADYTSTVQFLDALPFGTPAGATVTFDAPANWSCGGPVLFPTLYQCKSDNPNLGHMEFDEIIAKVKVPVATGASKCEVTNNALIVKAPGGTLINSFGGDDTDSATAVFEALFVEGQLACLSPAMGEPEPKIKSPEGKKTNLTITKAAGASQATATGQNTMFTITVTNEGPGVFKGPIVVRDTLFDGQTVEPSNGTWSAPWTCEGQSAAGHPEQGICEHPEIELDPGKSVVLKLEIEAPNSFVAPSGAQVKCGYKNKVEILKPAGGTPQNTNAGDDTATAEVKFAPFEKHGQTFCGPGLTTPPLPVCPQGWSSTPVPGKCCPPGSSWDGKQCTRDVIPPKECVPGLNELRTPQGCVCKSGYERDSRGNCIKVVIVPPEICVLGPNEVRTPLGKCVCKPGFERNSRGICVEPTPLCVPGKNEMRNDKGQCICKPGFQRDSRGNCVEPTPLCIPGKNEMRNDKGQCVCKPGFERDKRGNCVKPVPECGTNEVRSNTGECVCKPGYQRDKRGNCVKPVPECGTNEVRSSTGQCVCKSGFERDKRGNCVTSTPPACTGKNELRNDKGKCVCKPGFERDKRGNCVKRPDPAAACKAKGWNWDGKRCTPPLKTPVKPIKPKLKPLDPAVLCKAKGWTWTGSRCVQPGPSTVPR
ncbi:MAG TPA: hypothetical protein VLB11_03040 [Methyloceanibacter sp.]|nr:hypothetical protein [Methyloceanibacter sp.]